MGKYKLSKEAREDLRIIYKYTVINFVINQAKDYLNKFSNSFKALAIETLQGRKADIFKEGLRKLGVGSHTVFYFNQNNYILIIRVLHKSMDIKQHI